MLIKVGPNIVSTDAFRMAYLGRPDLRGVAPIEVVWADGTKEDLNFSTVEQLEAQTGTIVPATDGYKVIEAHNSEAGKTEFRETAIIAFRICGTTNNDVRPITSAGEPSCGEWSIVSPDKTCVDRETGARLTVDRWKAAVSQRAKEREVVADEVD